MTKEIILFRFSVKKSTICTSLLLTEHYVTLPHSKAAALLPDEAHFQGKLHDSLTTFNVFSFQNLISLKEKTYCHGCFKNGLRSTKEVYSPRRDS